MSEKKELEEKIVRLQNFHKIKDKKIKLMEDRIERQNKLIAKQKERINRAIKYINSNNFIGRIRLSSENKEAINTLLEILKGSDKE